MKQWCIYLFEMISTHLLQKIAKVCRYLSNKLCACSYQILYPIVTINITSRSINNRLCWATFLSSHTTALTLSPFVASDSLAILTLSGQYKQWSAEFTAVYRTIIGNIWSTLHGDNNVNH